VDAPISFGFRQRYWLLRGLLLGITVGVGQNNEIISLTAYVAFYITWLVRCQQILFADFYLINAQFGLRKYFRHSMLHYAVLLALMRMCSCLEWVYPILPKKSIAEEERFSMLHLLPAK